MAIRKILNKYWGWTFLLIPLALQAIFFYFPMVQGAFYSLTNWTGLTYNYKFVGLNNYKLLMIDGKFFTAIAFTLILTLALIIGEITIGMVVARALNSKMKGQTFFRAWFFFPAVLSGLTAFDQIFALTSGGPNNATTSLGLLVYNYAFKSNQYGYANAIALILFLIIGIVSLIQIKLSKKFEI